VAPAEQARLERSFFRNLCLPNGTHKTTAPGRLRTMDERAISLLSAGRPVRLLDVGISSGVTTLELLEFLESSGRPAGGVGIDIRIHAFLKRRFGMDLLFDSDGSVLQVATPFFARGRPDPGAGSVQSKLLGAGIGAAERVFARRWAARREDATPVTLVSPRLLLRPNFRVIEHDLLHPLPPAEADFDVVRAANVLNLAYFDAPALRRMAEHLAASLMDGGLLVIGRTDEAGVNHATFFRKSAGGPHLRPADRIGGGSEIEELVLGGPSGGGLG
jgi:hypothetical protein